MIHPNSAEMQYEMEVLRELQAATAEAESTTERYSHEEVIAEIRKRLKAVLPD